MIDKSILEKFIKDECSSLEAEIVINSLRENPSLLDELMDEEEWNGFQTRVGLSKAASGILLDEIKRRRKWKKPFFISILKYAMAAIIVLLVILGAWKLFLSKRGSLNDPRHTHSKSR